MSAVSHDGSSLKNMLSSAVIIHTLPALKEEVPNNERMPTLGSVPGEWC